MESLNRIYAQLSETIRSLSPMARLFSALLLAGLIGGLVYFASLQTRGSQTLLLGGHSFSTAELHSVQAAFGQAGLKDFEIHGTQIKIPSQQLDIYLAAMADADVLPADFGDYLSRTIREQSPWAGSRLHDQAIMAARERVLSNAVSKMAGIDHAQVFISVLDKPSFRAERLTTASVDVKMIGGQRLDSRQVRAIRSLVAGGTAGLKREQITVVDSTTGRDFPGTDANDPAAREDAYLSRQEAYERRFEDTILGLLTYVPDAQVRVHVELGEVAPDNREVLAAEASSDETPAATPVAADPNLVNAANAGAALPIAAASDTDSDPSGPATPITTSSTQPVPTSQRLAPRRVTASITIPGSYFEQLWQQRRSASEASATPDDAAGLAALRDEVCQRIQRHVLTVIPHDPHGDPHSLVSVTSFEQVTGGPIAPRRSAGKTAGEDSPNWRTIALIGFVAAGLAGWWSTIRSSRKTAGASQPSLADQPEDDFLEAMPAQSAARRRDNAGASLRDNLARSVREDPDAAAKILRTWIGNSN